MPEPISDQLCRLVLLGLLPAVLESDLDTFGSALSEIQQSIGRIFAPVQGGRFSHARFESLGETMTQLGLRGVGQSSWGPTLYGFSDQDAGEQEQQRNALINRFDLKRDRVFWTKASVSGATILTD